MVFNFYEHLIFFKNDATEIQGIFGLKHFQTSSLPFVASEMKILFFGISRYFLLSEDCLE